MNMTRARGKENLSPQRESNHDLPNTGRVLYLLSYENSLRARLFNWVHMWQASYILLGSALSKSWWVDPLLRFFLYPTLVSCWSIRHLSYFITELKIHHLYSLNISFVAMNQHKLTNTNCKQTQSSLLIKSTCQDDFLFTQRIISSFLMTDSYAHKSTHLSQTRSFKHN